MIVEVQGFKFHVTNGKDYIQQHWLNNKFYEEKLLSYIKKNCKGGNFIDVGSNMGNHSIFFSQIADTVYSFEPVSQLFNIQLENIELNKIKNIKTFQCALGNKEGMVGLIYNIANMGNTHVIETNYEGQADEFVLMYKLDNFKLKNITVMKVDVEGYEIEVLEGAKQTLQENDITIFVECLTPSRLKETSIYLDNLDYDTWKCLMWNYNDVRDGKKYQDKMYMFTKGRR